MRRAPVWLLRSVVRLRVGLWRAVRPVERWRVVASTTDGMDIGLTEATSAAEGVRRVAEVRHILRRQSHLSFRTPEFGDPCCIATDLIERVVLRGPGIVGLPVEMLCYDRKLDRWSF